MAIGGGFSYTQNSVCKADPSILYFECQFKKKFGCKGRITISGNIGKETTEHCHDSQCQSNLMEAAKFKEKILIDAPRLDIVSAKLVNTEYDKLHPDAKALLPKKTSLQKKANRLQRKGKKKLPKEDDDLFDFGMHH